METPWATLWAALALLSCSPHSERGAEGDAPVENSGPEADLLGVWEVVWMEGYVREELRITKGELPGALTLDYVQLSDVGDFHFQHAGQIQGDSLTIVGGYDEFGRLYDSLRLDSVDGQAVLIPDPNPGSKPDRGRAPSVYHKIPEAAEPGDAADRANR